MGAAAPDFRRQRGAATLRSPAAGRGCGLTGGGAKLPRARAAGLQRDQRLGVAHGARHAVDHRHRQAAAQRARQARERRAGEDDHVGAVVVDAALGERHQALALVVLHAADVGERLVEAADAREPTARP